ncbi:hydrogenase maturation protease [Candidatus Symbiobacter mobilis]|uniref:Hydrogenase maturation protease n=1 Tax=Candidatus Symbiobacter mobilis CR TaxID=946483 RepID=U5N9H1_9BURK|nr:hydrogenase maturation protease [Candidatus Symbiobacter mobilis]AGX88216.1 hydrogenase maturation protease [Candidatus Symbiobacter mobilis CR]
MRVFVPAPPVSPYKAEDAPCVVIGLGCPFLGDDSVGIQVVRALQGCWEDDAVRLVESHAGGLLLLEELAGTQCAIVIDALLDERRPVGEVVVAGIDGSSEHSTCGHDCDLPGAIALGKAMGLALPQAIHLVAIVAQDVGTFTETLSPAVQAAIPQACHVVQRIVAGEAVAQQTESFQESFPASRQASLQGCLTGRRPIGARCCTPRAVVSSTVVRAP